MAEKCVACGFRLDGLVTLGGTLRLYYGNKGSSKKEVVTVVFSDMACSSQCVLERIREALSNTDLPKESPVFAKQL